MKRIIAFAIVFWLYCMFGAKKVYAWYGATHADITKKALALIKKENMRKVADFYADWHEQLILGSKQPDFMGDLDNGAGSHYYSCVNRWGMPLKMRGDYYCNRLGRAMRSARTLFEENYTYAVSLYKSGDVGNAMRYLGRAIHFVEDMGCSVHSANMIYIPHKRNVHSNFESYASDICGGITAERFDKKFSKYYHQSDFGEALNELVSYSSKFSQLIRSMENADFENAAEHVLPYTQQNVAALMLRFYEDCHGDRSNFIIDGRKYVLINAATKRAVTVSEKGLITSRLADSELQKFKVELSGDGSFGLKGYDRRYVDKVCRDCERIDSGAKPAQFRAAAVGDRVFRVSVGNCGFKKVLSVNNAGKLTIEKFRPGNKFQLWVIAPKQVKS